MTIDDKIRDVKLQDDINREAAKILALSSGKIDKYEYLAGEEMIPSNRRQIMQEANFACSPLGKTLEEQTEKEVGASKTPSPSNKVDELKQVEAIYPQNLMNDLICSKLK